MCIPLEYIIKYYAIRVNRPNLYLFNKSQHRSHQYETKHLETTTTMMQIKRIRRKTHLLTLPKNRCRLYCISLSTSWNICGISLGSSRLLLILKCVIMFNYYAYDEFRNKNQPINRSFSVQSNKMQ